MGDTTNLQVYVLECPPDQRADVVDVLNEYELGTTWEHDPDAAPLAEVVLGTAYVDGSAYGDRSRDLAAELVKAAPGATFRTWTDPAYQWLGAGTIYAPDLGRFDYESDAEGEPCFGRVEVRQAIERLSASATRDDCLAAIDRATGGPWLRRMGEHAERLAAAVRLAAEGARCPNGATAADECSTIRERSVAGTASDVPGCPVHGVLRPC